MVTLSPKLHLKVAQKQILTPGLVQMVSVLALNKLELRDMIQAEMVENPVLEELDDAVPVLDEVARREEPTAAPEDSAPSDEKKDSFEEIDFDSYFNNYLDPGYRSPDLESVEKPSFENFLSKPGTLTDHLMWQLGAMVLRKEVRNAAEVVIGNLDEDGYLTATEEELMAVAAGESLLPANEEKAANAAPGGEDELHRPGSGAEGDSVTTTEFDGDVAGIDFHANAEVRTCGSPAPLNSEHLPDSVNPNATWRPALSPGNGFAIVPPRPPALFRIEDLREATELVRQMDPVGVASRDLRECLLAQLAYHQGIHQQQKERTGQNGVTDGVLHDAVAIVSDHLRLVQNKQIKELSKLLARSPEALQAAFEFIRTLDPRPGQRYNQTSPRLIEPDVFIVKHGDEYLALLNDDDVPQLRLNPAYRKLLNRNEAEKDVRTYVKEKYKSAIQLIKNIEQRKHTILKVCYAIIGRQREFLDYGIDRIVPMMIKEVAEEIGVHPSTVSRAVAAKYVHTPQGVFELRYFFSEGVQGPEGGNTSLLILKRRVKKLIEEEDPAKPYTDEHITHILQSQGIQVTRRTVAKYREDLHIPSTHQRRVKN